MKQKGLAPVFIVILVAVLAAGGYLIYKSMSFRPHKQAIPKPSYVSGRIIIGIKSGVKFKEAGQLIQSYNLTYEAPYAYKRLDFENKKEIPYDPEDIIGDRPVDFTVFVPQGEENEWIEIFNSSPIVKYATLNHYIYPQNK